MLTAQPVPEEVKLTQGEKEVIRSIGLLPRVFGHDNSGYFALTKDSRYGIAHYNHDLHKTGEQYLDLYESLKERDIVNIVHFHDSIYLFYYIERFSSRTLLVQAVNKDSLTQGQPRVLMQRSFVSGRKPEFGIVLARDRSKLLAYSSQIIYSSKIGMLEMMVLGAGLEREWKNSFRYGFERVPRHAQQFTVDSHGNVYMLDRFYTPVIPNVTGQSNSYLILAVTEKGTRHKVYEISLPEYFIKNILLEPADEGYCICAGFYSDYLLEGTVEGMFYFRINALLGIIQDQKQYSIDKMDFTSNERFGLDAGHLIYMKGGFSYFVAEQRFRESHNHYQNMLVSLFDPNGEIQWQRVIYKEQSKHYSSSLRRNAGLSPYDPRGYWPDGTPVSHSHPDRNIVYPADEEGRDYDREAEQEWEYSSYGIFSDIDQGWIAILYNDDLRNLESDREKRAVFSANRKSCLNMVRMFRNGNATVVPVYYRDRRRKPLPLPLFNYDSRQATTVFPASRRNNTFVLMSIQLNTK